jgi:hypothetical protein
VHGGALAQRPAQLTAGIPARTLRVSPEELGFGVSGQLGEASQINQFDPGD